MLLKQSSAIFNDNELSVEDNAEDAEHTGSIIWNYYKIYQSKWGGGTVDLRI